MLGYGIGLVNELIMLLKLRKNIMNKVLRKIKSIDLSCEDKGFNK